MFESPKSGFSGSSEGDIVPSIAVSRKYINTSQLEEGNVYIEHSYHSSIKNLNERNSQRNQNSSQSNKEGAGQGERQHLTTGVESFDLREKYPETGSLTFDHTQFYLQPTLNQVRHSTSIGHHHKSMSQPSHSNLDRPHSTSFQPSLKDTILLPKSITQGAPQARVSNLYVKEGDYIYEINARDLAWFQRNLQNNRDEARSSKMTSKVTGIQKQYHIKKQMGHMTPNLRPSSQNSILMRIEEKEKAKQRERDFLSEFLTFLKFQNKARLYRPDKNQKSFKPFTKEVLYTSKVDDSMLQQSTLAGFSEKPSFIQNQSNLGESTLMNWNQVNPQRPPSEIIRGAQSISHSQDISHKTICKSVIAPISQELRPSTTDLHLKDSKPISLTRPQSQQESTKNRGINRPSSQCEISRKKKLISTENQENKGDTRNIIVNKTASSNHKGNNKSSSRIVVHDNQKIDTRRSGSSGLENGCHIKPMMHLMNIPAVRKLINFKKLNSPGRHARQASQISSFIESNIDNVRDNLKPLINEDLDFPEIPSQSIVEISARLGNNDSLIQDFSLNPQFPSVPGGQTLSQSQQQMRPISPNFLNGQISTIMQESIKNQTIGQKLPQSSPQNNIRIIDGVECQTNLTYNQQNFDLEKPNEQKQSAKPWKQFENSSFNMKTVKIQEFKIEIYQKKEEVKDYNEKEVVENCQLSSQKGTKFSNSHIKMHINQSSVASITKDASPSVAGLSKSGRQSPIIFDHLNQEKFRRAQSLKKNHINQNFRMNASFMTKTVQDEEENFRDQNQKLSIFDPKTRTLNLEDLQRKREASTGMNLSKVYYDTPQFGYTRSLQPNDHNMYGFGERTESLEIQEGEFTINETGNKKNILISKKQQVTPKTENQAGQMQQQIMVSEFSPGKDPKVVPSVIPLKMDIIIDNESSEAQQNEMIHAEIQNLEHIIEETCESVDSIGRGESTHTMKSNFGPSVNLPMNEVKRKRSQLRLNNSHQNQTQKPVFENNEAHPLSSDRSQHRQHSDINRSQDQQDNNITPGRHRIVHSKRSTTPLDRDKQNLNTHLDNLRRASSNQLENQLLDHQITPKELGGFKHGSTGSLHSQQKIAHNFSVDNDIANQLSPLDKNIKVVSKVVGTGAHNHGIELNIHSGKRAGQRSQILEHVLSGGQTRGSYHHLSSKGEFDAPPRYHHGHESNPGLKDESFEKHGHKKGIKHETKIPGITKYQKIEVPVVESIIPSNNQQANSLGISHHQKNQIFFNHNSQAQFKSDDPLSQHNLDDDVTQNIPGGSGDLLTDIASAPKPRLVLKKYGKNTHHSKGLDTHDKQHHKKNRITYSVGTVVEMLSEIPGNDFFFADCDKKESPPHKDEVVEVNQIDKLDKKQAQMIRRNISVYRKANQKLKQLKQEKLDTRSRRQSLQNQSQMLDSRFRQQPANKSVQVQDSHAAIETEVGDQVYDQFINSQLHSGVTNNLKTKLRIIQSRTPMYEMNSDLQVKNRAVFSDNVSLNNNQIAPQSNHQIDKNTIAELGNLLKNDDSSTIKDEQSLYTPNLIHPKILSSHNLLQTNAAPSNLQIITNQGYSRMVNNSSSSKIKLPKTVVVSHSPLDYSQKQGQVTISQKRVGSALSNDRVGSYIKQMMMNINQNLESLGRVSVDFKALNSEVNQMSVQQTMDRSRPGSSKGAYQHLQMNTINTGSIPIHANYQSSVPNKHRRLKSSFTGRQNTNQVIGPQTAFGRGANSAASTQRQTEISKGVISNPGTAYGSRPQSNLNGLVVSSFGYNISNQPKIGEPQKIQFGGIQVQSFNPFGNHYNQQLRPGTTVAFNNPRPEFNLQLN